MSCAGGGGGVKDASDRCACGKSLGSLVEMCASNKTDGFRDEYSRTIRW